MASPAAPTLQPLPLSTRVAGTSRSVLVTLASRIAHAWYLLRRALRRALWAWPAAPRPGCDTLHLRWLNAALTARGLQSGGSAVVAVQAASLAVNRGMVGTIVRFNLTYNGVGSPGPASLILKVIRVVACASTAVAVQ